MSAQAMSLNGLIAPSMDSSGQSDPVESVVQEVIAAAGQDRELAKQLLRQRMSTDAQLLLAIATRHIEDLVYDTLREAIPSKRGRPPASPTR